MADLQKTPTQQRVASNMHSPKSHNPKSHSMGNHDFVFDDDDVAGILATEAKDYSLRYSAMGLEASRSAPKKPAHLPKPNTRFLRHVIQDTNSHNAALLAREAAESQARLDDLDRTEERARHQRRAGLETIRRRQLGDINAILARPRRRSEEEGKGEAAALSDRQKDGDRRCRHSSDRPKSTVASHDDDGSSWSSRRGRGEGERDDGRRKRRRRHSSTERPESLEEGHYRPRKRRRDMDRDRDRDKDRDQDKDRDKNTEKDTDSHKKRRRRTKHSRSRSPDDGNRARCSRCTLSAKDSHVQRLEEEGDDDPLDEFIGPAPPPKVRGRGATARSSGIDQRFAADYDPRADVDGEVAEDTDGDSHPRDNWEDALEARHDRLEWKRRRGERMRQAGFSDDVIGKLKAGGTRSGHGRHDALLEQQACENVRWAGPGEKREWDLGKEDVD